MNKCIECKLEGHEDYYTLGRLYKIIDPHRNIKTSIKRLCYKHEQNILKKGFLMIDIKSMKENKMFKNKNGGLKLNEKRLYGHELLFSIYKHAMAGNKSHVLAINIGQKVIYIPIPYNKNKDIEGNWKKPGLVFGLTVWVD
jgi:hypothetical protein